MKKSKYINMCIFFINEIEIMYFWYVRKYVGPEEWKSTNDLKYSKWIENCGDDMDTSS